MLGHHAKTFPVALFLPCFLRLTQARSDNDLSSVPSDRLKFDRWQQFLFCFCGCELLSSKVVQKMMWETWVGGMFSTLEFACAVCVRGRENEVDPKP